MPSAERLNRFLARRGVASRRGADGLIAAGRVAVNGRSAALGALVDPSLDRVSVDGRAVPGPAPALTIVLNKPPGYVSTLRDPQRRPTVMNLVPGAVGLKPVGRLDVDSRGLLLLTTDGELAHRVAHPRYGLHKRYRVTAREPVHAGQLRLLTGGVQLEDGPARALQAELWGARGVELLMGEGRKREVRRLCAAAGIEVRDLTRVAIGPLRLGRLHEGDHRSLRPDEERALRAAAGLAGAGG